MTLDDILIASDHALRTLSGGWRAAHRTPTPPSRAHDTEPSADAPLSVEEKALSASLMRVNHVGEVCAQALYQAQALATADPSLRRHFEAAAREETDHLVWTQQRLDELGARPSLLNPLWYAGSFALGWFAGRSNRALSLGFVVETERQVERHLDEHLDRLSTHDVRSRVIVQQMKDDEVRHALDAEQAGAVQLPAAVRWGMKALAKVMTTTAHRI